MEVRCIIAAAGAVGINALAASAMIGLSAAEPVRDARVMPLAVRLLPPMEPPEAARRPDAAKAVPDRVDASGAVPVATPRTDSGARPQPTGGPNHATLRGERPAAARVPPRAAPKTVTGAALAGAAVAGAAVTGAAVTGTAVTGTAAAAPVAAPATHLAAASQAYAAATAAPAATSSFPAPPPASIAAVAPDAPPAREARDAARADPPLSAGSPPGGRGAAGSAPVELAGAGGERRIGPRIDASWAGNAAPPYPAAARRLGEQGEVRLDVHVGPDGGVLDVRLRVSSGSPTLDRSAIDAVRRWRFTPATVDGRAIAEWYHDWRWVFRLEG
jgi:protein TonB